MRAGTYSRGVGGFSVSRSDVSSDEEFWEQCGLQRKCRNLLYIGYDF